MDKLTDKNHAAWKVRIQLVLQDRGLWKYVDGSCSPPAAEEKLYDKLYQAWEEKDQQARAQILLTVSDPILPSVRHSSTAKEAWAKIASVFEQKGLSAQVFLRRKLVNLRYNPAESMQTHLNTIRELVDQLTAINVTIKDEELAIITLCSLPVNYDSLIVSMESRPSSEITFDYVSNRLLAEHHRKQEVGDDSSMSSSFNQEKIFFARQLPRTCTHCKRTGHVVEKCWDKHPEQRPSRNGLSPTEQVNIF
jgi:hypothetical protein